MNKQENILGTFVCGLLTLGFFALFIHQAFKRNEGCILFFLLFWIFGSMTLDCIQELRKQ